MSQSPVFAKEMEIARDESSPYRQAISNLNNILRHGGSLSGREPNCAFLNLHGKSFANAGAVSGFDYADDTRGVATVDWDLDGDLDVWTTNRTAPRLRFLRNDLPNQLGNHFVSFRLEGRDCNRDAIGAKVSIVVDQDRQTKSVRAGEGFLSQSSKRLVFGIGPNAVAVSSVSVNWPDGSEDVFRDLPIDRHYRLVQHDAIPHAITDRPPSPEIQPGELAQLVEPTSLRIPLGQRIPIPALRYRPFEAQASDSLQPTGSHNRATDRELILGNGSPVLITIWASWCAPCIQELAAISQEYTRLEAQGLKVYAFSVDGVGIHEKLEPRGSFDDAASMATRLKLPFPSGQLTSETLARIELVHQLPFGTTVDLPVPLSLLVDSGGRLATIYRGQISVSDLLTELPGLAADRQTWQARSLQLPGRWNEPPAAGDLLAPARALVESGHLDDARELVRRNTPDFEDQKEFSKLLVWLGDELMKQQRPREAFEQYEAALRRTPNDLLTLNNLAWQLATHAEPAVRNPVRAVQIAEHAVRVSRGSVAGVLDTLAVSYAANGQLRKAIRAAESARKQAEKDGQNELAARIKKRLKDWYAQIGAGGSR